MKLHDQSMVSAMGPGDNGIKNPLGLRLMLPSINVDDDLNEQSFVREMRK